MLSGSESGIPLDVPTVLNRNSPEYKAYLLRKKHLLELEKKKKAELPHLFGFKHYWWSRIYFESMKRFKLFNSGQSDGKISVQIRKCVHWATESVCGLSFGLIVNPRCFSIFILLSLWQRGVSFKVG